MIYYFKYISLLILFSIYFKKKIKYDINAKLDMLFRNILEMNIKIKSIIILLVLI